MTVSECITEPSTSSIVAPAGVFGDKASRVRVLLVEGDPQTRATLAAVLVRQGFDVQSFDGHPAPHHPPSPIGRSAPAAEKIACGKLLIDPAQRRAWWDGAEVPLTAGEFDIVVLLVSNAGCCLDNRTVYDCLHYKGMKRCGTSRPELPFCKCDVWMGLLRDGRGPHASLRPSPSSRSRAISLLGALPKKRAYSLLNCDALR